MKVIVENELMKNHKAAEILPAQSSFESLQTAEGSAIFFCIGDCIGSNKEANKALYLIVEAPGQATGWQKADITSELSAKHQGSIITAKNFAVTQCMGNGEITIAVTVMVNNACFLYVLAELPSKSGSDWMKQEGVRNWIARLYDDATHPTAKLNITGLYLTPQMTTSGDAHHLLICAVRDTRGYLQNYTVDFSGQPAWQHLQTSENFNAVRSQLIGKAKSSPFSGLYQLTELNGGLTIDFTPLKSMYPNAPKTIIKLKSPDGAHKLATLPVDGQNNTDLFVAADNGIYLYTSDKQENFAEATKIISDPLVTGVQNFYVHQSARETIIWGTNQQGQVFSSRCEKGSELDSKAWSTPIPILNAVEQIASYVNHQESNSVIFAHTSGQNLVRLTQDPKTSIWSKSNILLPPAGIRSIIEYTTYTSHVQVTKDNNIPLGDIPLLITATSNCGVFINNVYYLLSPTVPIKVTADAVGQISIVQETDTLGAVCYHLETEDKSIKVDVNPMNKVINDINKQVNAGNIPGSLTPNQKEKVTAAVQGFVSVSNNMPQDGSIGPIPSAALRLATASVSPSAKSFKATRTTIWGISFEDGNWQHHSGEDAIRHFGLVANPDTDRFSLMTDSLQVGDIWKDSIFEWAGDIWNWLKSAYDAVEKIFIQLVDDIYNCFIEVAGRLYRFVLSCVNDVIQGIEFIFNKIKVFMEDLIKWVGFLFSWNDILVSHDVLKNVIKQYVHHAITQGAAYKQNIAGVLGNIQQHIDEWAGLQNFPSKENFSNQSAQSAPLPGQHSPQNNYGSTHLKNGLSSAEADIRKSPGITDKLQSLAGILENALKNEGAILANAYDDLKHLIGNFETLSLSDIIKALIGILGRVLVKTAGNIMNAAIDLVLAVVDGMWTIFETPLNIPVLSPLYHQITNNDLTLLDVVCLILAIPATLTYKLIKNQAPFPASTTTDILKSGSWDQMRALFNGSSWNYRELSQDGAALSTDSNLGVDSDQVKHVLIIFMNATAAFSTYVFSIVTIFKLVTQDLPAGTETINVIHTALFYCSTAPNITAALLRNNQQSWDVILGECIYGITVLQKFADIFLYNAEWKAIWGQPTKWLDCFLGISSMLTVAIPFSVNDIKNPKVADRLFLSCFTNSFWNLNRVCTPWVDKNTQSGMAVFSTKVLLIIVYGAGQLILAVEEGKNPK